MTQIFVDRRGRGKGRTRVPEVRKLYETHFSHTPLPPRVIGWPPANAGGDAVRPLKSGIHIIGVDDGPFDRRGRREATGEIRASGRDSLVYHT